MHRDRPNALIQGTVSPRLTVPPHIERPSYAETGQAPPFNRDRFEIHDEQVGRSELQIHSMCPIQQFFNGVVLQGLEKMRASGKLAAQVLDFAGSLVEPGITTDAIDKAVHKMIVENGAYPSPLNYENFPKSVCTSINECFCHGIPDSRQLQNGDLINIDVTVYLNGYHGDCSKMIYVGKGLGQFLSKGILTRAQFEDAASEC